MGIMATALRRAVLALSVLAVSFCAQADEVSGKRTVTYYGSITLTLPERVTRIATAWEAQNSIIAMLGYGDKIVATTRIVRDMPVFRKFVPSIKDAELASLGGMADVDVEKLLLLRPDILFIAGALPPAKQAQLASGGIAVAAFRANSMDALLERTLITGELFGPTALAKAHAFRDYFEANKARVAKALAGLPAEQRPRIYLAQGSPTATSGRPSLNQDWMDLGGAINVAEHWFEGIGNATGQVTVERVIEADPDVIIAMRASDAEQIRHDPRWKGIKAVREGRVYANPRGMFWWCRETSEEALQFLWLASILYPDRLNVDMAAETRAFYKQFYGYDLTDAEIADFLRPTN